MVALAVLVLPVAAAMRCAKVYGLGQGQGVALAHGDGERPP